MVFADEGRVEGPKLLLIPLYERAQELLRSAWHRPVPVRWEAIFSIPAPKTIHETPLEKYARFSISCAPCSHIIPRHGRRAAMGTEISTLNSGSRTRLAYLQSTLPPPGVAASLVVGSTYVFSRCSGASCSGLSCCCSSCCCCCCCHRPLLCFPAA